MANNAIGDLEKQTLLTTTQEGVNCLHTLKFHHSKYEAMYNVYLLILINGNKAVGTKSTFVNKLGITGTINITVDHFREVYLLAQTKPYKLFKTASKAGKDGAFETFQSAGIQSAMCQRQLSDNPVTGPKKNSPSLVEYALNKIHPKFTESLEKYCNMIKTHAYLSLPAMSFGSLQRVVAGLNGVVGAFQKVIFSVYKGVMNMIKQFYAAINAIMATIQKEIISLIEQIIPLDLICLILETVQVIMDDISFFSSLFGQSGSIFQYLNTFQTYLNQASTLVSNPFSTLSAYMPPEIKNIIDMVDQIGSDPSGFLTDQLSNFGYAWAVNALQGDILGAVINKYGAQYAAIGPVSQLLNSGENYQRNLEYYPPTPAVIGPNINLSNSKVRDQNGNIYPNPTVCTLENLGISGAITDLGNSVNTLGSAVSDLGTAVSGDINNLAKNVGLIQK